MKYPVIMVSLIATMISSSALSQDLAGQLQQCQQIASALKRLDCYDQLAKSSQPPKARPESDNKPELKATQQTAAEPTPPAPAVKPDSHDARKKAEAEFGLTERPDEVEVERLEGVVKKHEKGPRGKWVITLDNGQVWKQKDSDYFSFPDDGAIYIKEGMFGAFYLSAEDTNRSIKVKRIR